MNKRLDYIDKAKGILIILMVIGHIWQKGYMHSVIYSFHMPAFFAISGMLLSHTKSYEKDFRQFLAGRVYAFGIPFLFMELLGILTDILRNGITLNFKGYLFNTITLIYNNINSWFLFALLAIEIIFVVFLKTIKNHKKICCVCLLLFFGRHLMPKEVMYVEEIIKIMKNLLLFAAGFYSHAFISRVSNSYKMTSVTAFALLLIAVWIDEAIAIGSWLLKDFFFLFTAVAGTNAVLCIAQHRIPNQISKVFDYSGRNSLIILETHRIYHATVGVFLSVKDFSATPFWKGMIMLVGVALLEIPTIYIINRWLPFLAGKRYKKAKTVAAA